MVLVDQGRPAEALGSLEEAVRLQPDDASTRRLLAYALMQLGRFADAEAEAREALRLKPGWAKAYSLLNVITGFESGDPDLGEIEAMAGADGELPVNERVHLYFTLARSYDKSGAFDRAFELLSTANALERERWSYDVEVEERDAERIVETVDGRAARAPSRDRGTNPPLPCSSSACPARERRSWSRSSRATPTSTGPASSTRYSGCQGRSSS